VSDNDLFDKGLEVRREILGAEYVDASLASADDFLMGFQRLLTEWAWATRGAGQVSIAKRAVCSTLQFSPRLGVPKSWAFT
jgi:hypothetical protein